MSEQFTLVDYNERILKPTIARFVQSVAEQDLQYAELFKTISIEPPTRHEKLARWWRDKVHRAKDIWLILRGGDIHADCGW